RERQERRASRGRKVRDKIGMPTIMLNAMRQTSEQTTARLADTMAAKVDDAQAALVAARERVAERKQLDIDLAPVTLPAGKVVLDLEGGSFRHAGAARPTLAGVTLRLVGPERVALVGPNGSGKTTLLRLILGQLQPDAGRVAVGIDRLACLDQRADLLR